MVDSNMDGNCFVNKVAVRVAHRNIHAANHTLTLLSDI